MLQAKALNFTSRAIGLGQNGGHIMPGEEVTPQGEYTMLGLKNINRRLTALEQRLDKQAQKKKCTNGEHAWHVLKSSFEKVPPYICCEACGAVVAGRPKEKK